MDMDAKSFSTIRRRRTLRTAPLAYGLLFLPIRHFPIFTSGGDLYLAPYRIGKSQ
jgi:hypothetical protein